MQNFILKALMQFQKRPRTGYVLTIKRVTECMFVAEFFSIMNPTCVKKNFFVKKVLQEAIEIKNGKREILEVGNLEIRRDFGYAPKFVEAMYLMMQKDKPANYLICSGKSLCLKHIVDTVFEKLTIDKSKIKISEELYRPAEIENIYGNPEKAKRELDWQYDMSIYNIIDVLLKEEIDNYNK